MTFLREQGSYNQTKDALEAILLVNHPAFAKLATLTNASYRVYFTNHKEFESWLAARQWKPLPQERWDNGSVEEFVDSRSEYYIKITKELFDKDGRLISISPTEWNDDWITKEAFPNPDDDPPNDDDIPF